MAAVNPTADPPPLPPNFPLPAVHQALEPYLAPPSSTLQTRHLISTHLQSLISSPRVASASGNDLEFSRFLDHELSFHPSPHRDYLTALRAHSAARAEYNHLSSELTPEPELEPNQQKDDETDAAQEWKADYLIVQQLKLHEDRLKVLREGLSTLAESPALRPLHKAYEGPDPPLIPAELQPGVIGGNSSSGGFKKSDQLAEEKILELQIRIAATKLRAKKEKKRAKAAEERARRNGITGEAAKRRGLMATQIELNNWLEEKLKSLSLEDSEIMSKGESPKKQRVPREPEITPEQMKEKIDRAYEEYLESRQNLLSLMTPIPTPGPLKTEPSPEDIKAMLSRRLYVPEPVPKPSMLAVIEAAEKVAPLKAAQKSTLAARNFFTSELRRAAIVEDDDEELRKDEADRMFTQMERESIVKLDHALQSLEAAKGVIKEVEELTGAPKEKRGIPVRSRGRTKVTEEDQAGSGGGIWAGLKGDVGVIGDGI